MKVALPDGRQCKCCIERKGGCAVRAILQPCSQRSSVFLSLSCIVLSESAPFFSPSLPADPPLFNGQNRPSPSFGIPTIAMSSVKSPQTRLQTKRMAGSKSSNTFVLTPAFLAATFGSLFVTATVFTYGFFKFHKHIVHVPHLNSASDRLTYALQLQVFSLIPILISIIYVIYQRVRSGGKAVNPLSGNEHFVEKSQAILRNTLEQFIFAFVNQLILATHLPADSLHIIPFLVFYFVFGRIAFTVGYIINPMYRGLGFWSTILPSLLAFFANLTFATGLNKRLSFFPHGSKHEL